MKITIRKYLIIFLFPTENSTMFTNKLKSKEDGDITITFYRNNSIDSDSFDDHSENWENWNNEHLINWNYLPLRNQNNGKNNEKKSNEDKIMNIVAIPQRTSFEEYVKSWSNGKSNEKESDKNIIINIDVITPISKRCSNSYTRFMLSYTCMSRSVPHFLKKKKKQP